MGFPSPETDFPEATFNITNLRGYNGNCQSIKTVFGYAIINVKRKPEAGNTVLILFCGLLYFATVQVTAFITQDGEAIEHDVLNDVSAIGVVPYLLNRVTDNRPMI